MMRAVLIALAMMPTLAVAQPVPPRPEITPSDERISGIVAQQALINARLSVEIDQYRQTIRKLENEIAKLKQELEKK